MSANEVQYGGGHYKQFKYQTWDVIHDWGLGYFDGNAVKYLSRWRLKNGIEDLRKARHYIDKLIENLEQAAAAAKPPPPEVVRLTSDGNTGKLL